MNGIWDILSQFGIAVFGIFAIALVARKNKWGFVCGLLSQPFWFITSYTNGQWGIFALSIVYAFTWIYGTYEWFVRPKRQNQAIRRKLEAAIKVEDCTVRNYVRIDNQETGDFTVAILDENDEAEQYRQNLIRSLTSVLS